MVNVAPTALILLFQAVTSSYKAVGGHNITELTLSIASSSVCCITDFPGLPMVQKKVQQQYFIQ